MIDSLFECLSYYPLLVALISVFLNIIIAISGVLPSAFITAGTVGILGFENGLIILIIGEAAGAMVSFFLYRKGVYKLSDYLKIKKFENKYLRRLQNTEGIKAFLIVILLRVLPFVPSGIVTLTAAISKMNFLSFSIASTLGKIPALYIEAYSVYHVLNFQIEWQLGIIIFVIALFITHILWKRIKQ